MSDEIIAGKLSPSSREYVVTCIHDHQTLAVGDVVVLPWPINDGADYFLLRVPDMTLHKLQDNNDQYVHVKRRE